MQGGESAGSSYLSLAIDGQPTFSDAKRDLRATGGVMSMGRGAAAARCRRYQLRRERTVMSPMKTAQRARSSPCKAFKQEPCKPPGGKIALSPTYLKNIST